MAEQKSELSRLVLLALAVILLWFGIRLWPLLSAALSTNRASIFVSNFLSTSGDYGASWVFRDSSATGTLLRGSSCSMVSPRLALVSGLQDLLLGQRQEAIHEMQCALEGSLEDPLVRFYLGALYYPSSPDMAIEVWRTVPEVAVYLARLGSTRYANGYVDEAISFWTASHQIDPEPHWRKTQMYLELCEIEERRGDITEALYWCRLAELSNRGWPTLLTVGNHYLALKNHEGAEDIAHELLARESLPPHPRAYAYRLLGRIYLNKGQNEKALAEYARALDSSRDAGLLFEVGDIYVRMREYELAVATFREVVSLAEGDALRQRASDYIVRVTEFMH